MSREASQKVKRQVFAHYGTTCVVCGESDLRCLTIDHKRNNGGKHRREVVGGSGTSMYYWLRRNGFPRGYQPLCFTCNAVKQYHCKGKLPTWRRAERLIS